MAEITVTGHRRPGKNQRELDEDPSARHDRQNRIRADFQIWVETFVKHFEEKLGTSACVLEESPLIPISGYSDEYNEAEFIENWVEFPDSTIRWAKLTYEMGFTDVAFWLPDPRVGADIPVISVDLDFAKTFPLFGRKKGLQWRAKAGRFDHARGFGRYIADSLNGDEGLMKRIEALGFLGFHVRTDPERGYWGISGFDRWDDLENWDNPNEEFSRSDWACHDALAKALVRIQMPVDQS
ncbi:MAG: hypothetical protein O6922_05755 [Chloroflexi bacterium]|nr:hypothetical protein [Chloroflexota bacterium]